MSRIGGAGARLVACPAGRRSSALRRRRSPGAAPPRPAPRRRGERRFVQRAQRADRDDGDRGGDTDAEQRPRQAVRPTLLAIFGCARRRAGQRRRHALPQHRWMRVEQLAAQRGADQRVAHRTSARVGSRSKRLHEQRALVGRKLVVDEGGDLVVDLVCHGSASGLVIGVTTTAQVPCRSLRERERCASARCRRGTPWSARSLRSSYLRSHEAGWRFAALRAEHGWRD